MPPKIAFAIFLFGCALLALVNAESHRIYHPNYNVNLRHRTIETPTGQCCPCPEENAEVGEGSQKRHANPRFRMVEKPTGECECTCENRKRIVCSYRNEDSGNNQNLVSAYEKIEPRRG